VTRPAPRIPVVIDSDVGANLDGARALARACASSKVERCATCCLERIVGRAEHDRPVTEDPERR
jgi:hypothetical protein